MFVEQIEYGLLFQENIVFVLYIGAELKPFILQLSVSAQQDKFSMQMMGTHFIKDGNSAEINCSTITHVT